MNENAPPIRERPSENIVKLKLSREIEMRNVIMLMVAIILSYYCQAQAPQRPNHLNSGLNRNSPIRVAAEEEKFNQDNPSGTNEFNRTFCQQVSYNKAFAPKHFLGFEFGKKYESYGQNLKLAKPFRMFDTITLYHSDLDSLSLVKLRKDIENVSLESAIAEVDKVANLLRRKYQIEFCHWKGDGSYHFDNDYSEITISCFTYNGRATGLFLSIRNKAVEKRDYDEKLKADSKRQAAIDIPVDAGADLLSVDKPNVELGATNNAEEKAKRESEEKSRMITEREAARDAEAKRNAEDEQKKFAAREELEGWPQEMGGYNPFLLSVYGTNVQGLVNNCCSGVVGVHSSNEMRFDLTPLCEETCNVAFSVVGGHARQNVQELVWEQGKNRCLIDPRSNEISGFWRKYDETGRLEKWGHRTQFSEYVMVTNQHAVISARLREAWAKKHGLTLEQAEKRARELIEMIGESAKGGLRGGLRRPGSLNVRPGLVGGSLLGARRRMLAQQAQEERAKADAAASVREAERRSQAEAEKAQHEAERAQQRQQLQAIQEELKRVREAKAAAEMAK